MKLTAKITIVFLVACLTAPSIFAENFTPKTIIIIRHGDKLDKTRTEVGPTLSPKGITRSMAFALFFINNLKTKMGYPLPDYIFATSPLDKSTGYSKSFRHLQTIAPLVSWMCYKNQVKETNKFVNILSNSREYEHLAQYIFSKSDFNGKTILICWSHETILPGLVKELIKNLKIVPGSTQLPPKWNGNDYSSIIILDYNKGSVKIKLLNQNSTYTVPDNIQSQMAIIKNYYSLF